MFGHFVFLHLRIRSCLFITKTASVWIGFSSHVQPLCVSLIYFSDLPRIHLVLPVKYTKAHKTKGKEDQTWETDFLLLDQSCELRHLFKRLLRTLENLKRRKKSHLFSVTTSKSNIDDITFHQKCMHVITRYWNHLENMKIFPFYFDWVCSWPSPLFYWYWEESYRSMHLCIWCGNPHVYKPGLSCAKLS